MTEATAVVEETLQAVQREHDGYSDCDDKVDSPNARECMAPGTGLFQTVKNGTQYHATWSRTFTANSTQVIVNTHSHQFDMSEEVANLNQVFSVRTLDEDGFLDVTSFQRKVRGLKKAFLDQGMTPAAVDAMVESAKRGAINSKADADKASYSYYYNSWDEINHSFTLFHQMTKNLIYRLHTFTLEINAMMGYMILNTLEDEVERERVARIMGSAYHMSQVTTPIAIEAGKSDQKDSSEIGAAAFISFANFLVVLFNGFRFIKLFFKTRGTEKLVATDMTFATADE